MPKISKAPAAAPPAAPPIAPQPPPMTQLPPPLLPPPLPPTLTLTPLSTPPAAPAATAPPQSASWKAPVRESSPPACGLMVNLGDVPDSGIFQLLPEDTFIEAQILTAEYTRAQSGNDMIKLSMEVTFPLEFDGAPIWDQVVITSNSLWKFKSLLKATDNLSARDAQGNQHFTGTPPKYGDQVTELVSEVVRFKTKRGETNTGRPRNEVATAYVAAFETPGLSGAGEPASEPVTW